jgi:hypothetical protein
MGDSLRDALANDWQAEWERRIEFRDSLITEENRAYQQGFADALRTCIDELRQMISSDGDAS